MLNEDFATSEQVRETFQLDFPFPLKSRNVGEKHFRDASNAHVNMTDVITDMNSFPDSAQTLPLETLSASDERKIDPTFRALVPYIYTINRNMFFFLNALALVTQASLSVIQWEESASDAFQLLVNGARSAGAICYGIEGGVSISMPSTV